MRVERYQKQGNYQNQRIRSKHPIFISHELLEVNPRNHKMVTHIRNLCSIRFMKFTSHYTTVYLFCFGNNERIGDRFAL